MKYTQKELDYMRTLAEQAVDMFVKYGEILKEDTVPEALYLKRACFVTIYKSGELRGCIGTIEPSDSLYKNIIQNAISAATRDFRFYPVTEEELPFLKYEVTVLSQPKDISYKDKESLFSQIEQKGVIIKKGFYTSVYLPQVWEQFKSKEDFISSLCQKAGMDRNEWKKFDLKVKVFESVK
ncbi:MAG TPA: AmmeMemoRadiSam system protein A [Ignavibacteria bacterium]|nr:AmmeMemoRadiSam system protein A [Ignavibacteria bacterium]